mgnify:CR=1 FL=1
MPSYKAPIDDVEFLLDDVFHIDRYSNLPGFADASPDVISAILTEAAKFCEEVLTPLNRVGDIEGCTRNADSSVTTPKGFKDAFVFRPSFDECMTFRAIGFWNIHRCDQPRLFCC